MATQIEENQEEINARIQTEIQNQIQNISDILREGGPPPVPVVIAVIVVDTTGQPGNPAVISSGFGKKRNKFDVYIDANPKDTIPIKYATVTDVKKTIRKLERLFKSKKYTHKRIWQVGMIMKVRLDALKKHNKKARAIKSRVALARRYFKFLGRRTKKKGYEQRKAMVFKL